jgi:hypothetical protein
VNCPFTGAELEAYVLDLVDAPGADEIEAHIRSCCNCRDEIDWLRLEQASFSGRRTRTEANVDLWQAIEAEIGDSATRSQPTAKLAAPRHRVVWFGSGFAAATMAAAVLVLYLQVPQVSQPRLATTSTDAAVASVPTAAAKPDPAVLALDQAEADYSTAIDALEAEYIARRGVVNPAVAIAHDRTMRESRRIIGQARAEAGDNINARVRVLDAYSSHLRTVQAVVAELDPVS